MKYTGPVGQKELFLTTCEAIRAIRRSKTQNGFRLGSEVKSILLVAKKEDIELLALAKNDLITAARCNVLDLEVGKELDAKILN